MKVVRVDEERCVGCGICAKVCPEGFEIVNGIARIKNDKESCLQEAAGACPRGAIMLGQKDGVGVGSTQGFGGLGRGAGRGMGRVAGRGMGGGGNRGMGGRGRMGGFAAGPGGSCICPRCGYVGQHQLGQPCNKSKCPKCGSVMTRGE